MLVYAKKEENVCVFKCLAIYSLALAESYNCSLFLGVEACWFCNIKNCHVNVIEHRPQLTRSCIHVFL